MPTAPTPLYVRLLSGLVSPFPDFDFGFIKPVRRRAIDLLQLTAGSRVLDVGCGSGGAFPYLVDAVGASGEVIGVELSAASASHARRRAAKNGWGNVRVLQAAAEDVRLSGLYDGLLMFAAPDVYASDAALNHLVPFLRQDARIVFFGARRSNRRFGWLLNGVFDFALRRLSLPTTPGLEPAPWRHVAPHVRDLAIDDHFHGWMFVASGSRVADRAATRTTSFGVESD